MTAIIDLLQNGLSFVIPMVVLLGLLIFVHELGHFLVAKYFKVRVEVFSLGFGPKLFKFRRGDTTYAISAIPLGGYVKMFGDDPTAQVHDDHKSFSFIHKPVGQRIAVVLAGPLMNFFFAILLFMGVALLGEQALSPKVGDVAESSPAYKAGFRSGDVIAEIGSDKIVTWDDVQKRIENGGDHALQFNVKREAGSETTTLTVYPQTINNKNVLSWAEKVGEIQGLSFTSRSSVVAVPDAKSLAGLAGIHTGDLISSVNGQKIERWRDLLSAVSQNADKEKLVLGIEHEPTADKKEPAAATEITLAIPTKAKGLSAEASLQALGFDSPELYLAGFEDDKTSPAAKAGLQKNDKLVSIDNKPVDNFEQVAASIRAFNSTDKPLQITVLRDGERKEFSVIPNVRERMNPQGKEEKRFEIGIRPLIVDAPATTFEWSAAGPVAGFERGFSQTMKWTSLTVLSFVRLFQNQVSPKNIGGFFSIGQMAKRSWQIGMSPFLNVMAIISINLFILNLLPVPILDGGHLLFFSIEMIKGAPLSIRKLEILQQVGLILLIGLMVFALFNDVTRMIHPS
jgi:regulator of sigma E protease